MRRAVCCAVVLVLFGVSTGESLAGIIVTSDDRYVTVPGPGANSWVTNPPTVLATNTVEAPPGSNWNEYITSISIGAGAAQNTSLGADGFSGTGNATFNGYGTTDPVTVMSVFDVSFQVTQQAWFSLGGGTNNFQGGVGNPPAVFSRSLTSSVGGPVAIIDEDRPLGEFFAAGVLVPGVTYRLVLSGANVPLTSGAYGNGEWVNWSFGFTVPEPALTLPLAAALALVCLVRRRRA